MSKKRKIQRTFRVKASINGETTIFNYTTYRTEGKKILSGIIIRALRRAKNLIIYKGKTYRIEIEILGIKGEEDGTLREEQDSLYGQ